MASKIKAQTEAVPASRTCDATAMEVLDRLDTLRGLARQTGDQVLTDGLDAMFEGFLTRYCEMRRESLNTQISQDLRRPKPFMH